MQCSILIVDDQASSLLLYKSILEDEGHQVVTAASRDEALVYLHRAAPLPDFVLLDCNMPGMPNAEFKVAVDKVRGRTQVVGFSNFSEQSSFAVEMRNLFGDFIEKPSDVNELLNAVHVLCTKAMSA